MIKNFIVALVLLVTTFTLAQEATSSPYSFYGIGDIRFKGTTENRAMAGLSIIPDSIHINLQNPAMYSGLKLITYTLSGSTTKTNLVTNTASESAQRTALDYLAVAIPLKKFGFGFGLIPYSSVGYKVSNSSTTNDGINNLTTFNQYRGKGGINKVFLGTGFKLTKNLSFGAEAQYNFGTIETVSISKTDILQFGTVESNISYASGINLVTGLSFQTKYKNKYNFFSGLTYSPEATLNFALSRTIGVANVNNFGQFSFIDTSILTSVTNVPDQKVKLPNTVTFGVGFGKEKKWVVGAEFTFKETSKFSNRIADIPNAYYKNATKITLGGYFIPNYNSYTSYFKKVVYRGGLRYENTGLVLNGKPIEDAALTLGLGLPMVRGLFSNANFGFEYGYRGTKSNGLIRENYLNLSISLSLNDKWFVKRRFN